MERPWQRHYDYCVPTTIRYPRIPVQDLVRIPANIFPDKTAMIFMGTEITFSDLQKQIRCMANALSGLGVGKGDRVGLHLPNCPQYVITYYAILSLGAIVVNVNPMYTPNELKHIVDNTGLTTLVTADITLEPVRALCQTVELDRVIVTSLMDYAGGQRQEKPASLDLPEGWLHFITVLDGCSDTRRPRVDIAPHDPAQLQFTGGTTGVPKGATLTHANIVAATFQSAMWCNSTIGLTPIEKRTVMAVLPYFHAYGNIVVMNWSMLNCATQLQVPRFKIDEFMYVLAQCDRITFFPAVPTMINAIVNHSSAGEMDLGGKLSMLNSGGAPMPVELIEQVQDLGIPYSEGWGMSETTSLGFANPALGFSKIGSIGIPFPDMDARLVDLEQGVKDVPAGEPGELIVKGPLVMKGYWDDPEKTADQLRDGWLYTGDIAVRDEDDYFFIVDRKKDMIIAGGFNIYPREIDELLYQHPKVQEAVAVGIHDEYRGETVKAFIVLKEGESATEEEIISFCREHLAAYKAPKFVEFRDELPKSAIGKVLRKILRAEEEARTKDK